jgi:signal transduction histidine kinase
MGFSNLLKEHLSSQGEDNEAEDYLHRIMSSCNNMNELIEGLLKLSRVSSGEFSREQVDISSLSHDIISEISKNDEEHEVEIEIANGLIARGDGPLLRMALTNLLTNAWKFTHGCQKPRIEVGLTMDDRGHKAFYVRDNGAGFDPEEVGKLFTPFQRLHSRDEFEGTGIGLATVKRILTRHGGDIWATGKPGEGATFYFTLPGIVTPGH